MDRENVVKGLECIAGNLVYCTHCKYSDANGYGRGDRCKRDCAKDALALLKAQEPNEDWISRKRLIDEIQYYIDEAGWGDEANKVLGWCMEFIDNQMAVKWDG